MSIELCPICGYSITSNENALGCQCMFEGSCHSHRDKMQEVVFSHLYLLSPKQLEHIVKLQEKQQISYTDKERQSCLNILIKNGEIKNV